MQPQVLLYAVLPLIILLGIYASSYFLLLRSLQLDGCVSDILKALVVTEIILLLLNILAWESELGFFRYFLDFDEEFTFGSLLQSTLLVSIAVLALLIALTSQLRVPLRLYLLLIGGGFAYLGLDEFFVLHEQLLVDQNMVPIPYIVGGVIWGLLSLALLGRRLLRRDPSSLLILFGAGMIVTGGVVFEKFSWDFLCIQTDICKPYTVIEEALEVMGSTFVLTGLLALAQKEMASWRLTRVRRICAVLAVGYAALCLAYVYVLPGIEQRLWAHPVQATFLNGELELLGYRLSSDQVAPGGNLTVTLYLRANSVLDTEYSYSLHALTRKDLESVGQIDDLRVGAYPSDAWLPGVVVSKTVRLPVRKSVQTPQGILVTLRLWYGDWQESWENTTGLLVEQSNVSLLTPDTLILETVGAISPEIVDAPITLAYRFGEWFSLTAYQLPEYLVPGESSSFDFWWEADNLVDTDFVQFVHIVGSDNRLLAAYDGNPFGDLFHTQDWPVGLISMDTRTIAIPAELDSGEVSIYTGMYNADTMVRLPVYDDEGQRLENDMIDLGVIPIVNN